MKLDDRALPLTRQKLDIGFGEETGWTGTESQLGLFTTVGGMVNLSLPKRAFSKVLRKAGPLATDFFETDGRFSQKAIDYPTVALDFGNLSRSRLPVQEAPEPAASIQPAPIPFAGLPLKFAFFGTSLMNAAGSHTATGQPETGHTFGLVGRWTAIIHFAFSPLESASTWRPTRCISTAASMVEGVFAPSGPSQRANRI